MDRGIRNLVMATALALGCGGEASAQFYSGYSYSYQFGPSGYAYNYGWATPGISVMTPWTSVNVTPYGYVPYPGTVYSPVIPLAPIPRNRYDYGGGYLGRYRRRGW